MFIVADLVSLIEAFCHFSDVVYGAIFSQEVFIIQFAFVNLFVFFSQSLCWFLGEINVKTRTERLLSLMT